MASEKLSVGQTLWWVPGRGTPSEVTVAGVGRKWAQLDNHKRIDVVTLEADGAGYTSPGRCYRDRSVYEAGVHLAREWADLRKAVSGSYIARPGVTVEQIVQAKKLLGF